MVSFPDPLKQGYPRTLVGLGLSAQTPMEANSSGMTGVIEPTVSLNDSPKGFTALGLTVVPTA